LGVGCVELKIEPQFRGHVAAFCFKHEIDFIYRYNEFYFEIEVEPQLTELLTSLEGHYKVFYGSRWWS
jgi:hypothetical protein